jgi:phosphate transport system permease protein
MSVLSVLLVIAALTIAAWFIGRNRAAVFAAKGDFRSVHSLPAQHGAFAAIACALPALAVLIAWLLISPAVIEASVESGLPADVMGRDTDARNLAISQMHTISDGLALLSPAEREAVLSGAKPARDALADKGVALAADPEPWMLGAAEKERAERAMSRLAMGIATIGIALVGGLIGLSRIAPRFRARNIVERVVRQALLAASSIAILTTVGIVMSMLSETLYFFAKVSPADFFFGTVWDPRFAAADRPDQVGQFGLIPLLAGTLYIGLVAMIVAAPIGLFAAIYMSEYASPKVRAAVKPLLEVLAGIPTVVYGFFALVTVGPFLRDLSAQLAGLAGGDVAPFIQAQSVLTAGFVMGIMLIPFVSSLSDDIITAVPLALSDGSLALGATRSETMKRVVLPAALPGVVGALLLTASRAIGETMIVVLAAGVAARLSLNPFEPMTTVTVKIVSQLTGDLEFTSPQTLVAFALGMTLFFITLGLNVYALYIVRKYREQYE